MTGIGRVHRGEVDGVNTYSLDEGVVQGPLQACLVFGTGRSDETLLSAGINHVVEHLALQPLGTRPYGWNGSVGAVSTRFIVTGSADNVVDFLGAVSSQLSDLCVARLSEELRVLQLEAGKRSAGQLGFDLSTRYGPRGPGLLGWAEYGLRRLGEDEVTAWAQDRFTAQNAALWINGPIPQGLSLAKLPQGRSLRRADPPPPIPPSRAWVPFNTQTVSLSVVSNQQWGVIPAMTVARQRAFKRLRLEESLSYAVEFSHLRIGGGYGHEYVAADGRPESFRHIVDELSGVLDEVSCAGPSDEEWEVLQGVQAQMMEHPQWFVQYLDTSSERYLLGLDVPSPEESGERMARLTPQQVRDDLASVMPSLVAVGPNEVGEELPGWATVTGWSEDQVPGKEYRPIVGREKGRLIVGAEGISWALDDLKQRTVRWDTAACLAWDNGLRTLIAESTGVSVRVAPWNWQGGYELTSLVDQSIDLDRLIPMGEGTTSFKRDLDDDSSIVDIRWLGSVVGAWWMGVRVDLVLDVYGILLLRGPTCATALADRLQELRSRERDVLLAENSSNRWIPEAEIVGAELKNNRLARISVVKGTFTIRTVNDVVKVQLTREDQVKVVRENVAKMIGSRFLT